jgi:hypothetical protein
MAKPTGKFAQSAEGKRAHRQLCADLKLISSGNERIAGNQYEAGDDKGGDESMRMAEAAKADAKKWGCN